MVEIFPLKMSEMDVHQLNLPLVYEMFVLAHFEVIIGLIWVLLFYELEEIV